MTVQLLRTFRRKFGITAPRVAVRTHVPWYLRWLVVAVVGALVFSVGWATYKFGMEFAGFRQGEADRALATLNEAIGVQRKEVGELRLKVAQAERQLQIERATYGDLAKQVKALTDENATLKEDLAFFQSLMPASGTDDALTINRFRLRHDALPGEYRYRLLLVQTGRRVKEFQGSLQFVIDLEQEGRKVVLSLPADRNSDTKDYQLKFRFFQRIEGTFRIPPEASLKSMQVRVFEKGSNTPKLRQSVEIS